VEIVDELDFVHICEDEVTHGSRLGLREGEWARERLRTGVLLAAEVTMREPVVTVQVDSGVGVVTAEPFASPRVIFILALHDVIGCLEEGLLDVKDAVNIKDGHDVESDVLK